MLVAARNDIPAAKRLLAQGADVNAKSKDDYTALMYAAYYGTPRWWSSCSTREPT